MRTSEMEASLATMDPFFTALGGVRPEHETSVVYYTMARDCLKRARLFQGNSKWFLEEMILADTYRTFARKYRKASK